MFFYTLLLYVCAGGLAHAFPADSLEVSLLTCSPGEEVYSLYGHTAIRVKSYATDEDLVFNYGVFSFSRPHFIWRFTLGECDYRIDALPFARFAREYEERGSSVYQQVLNLLPAEKERLRDLLAENMRPENREYRYNFLYDNCTTRARDRIEEAVDGIIVYPEQDAPRTYREIIHLYTARHPWAELGNDICLGAGADCPVSAREEMFAPFCLSRYADGAVIREPDGGTRPLVSSRAEVVAGRGAEARREFFPSPALCAWVFFLCVAGLTATEWHRHACFWVVDVVSMSLVGSIGLVVTFLLFFSSHPTVGSNWQVWVFNPVPLIAMPRVVWCAVKGRKTRYHASNASVLILFMLFSALIPQDFCAVVVPLALVSLLRSCSYWMSYRKRRIQASHAS